MSNIDIECKTCKHVGKHDDEYPCSACANNNGVLIMYEEVENFDEISKAQHYNSNPSGIECADISQYFDNCRGQAIQYIWRAEDKGNPIKDLKKAIYWLERKIKLYEEAEAEEE